MPALDRKLFLVDPAGAGRERWDVLEKSAIILEKPLQERVVYEISTIFQAGTSLREEYS
ncbi:hypothetical protein D3C75_1158270 [compost metagenome]